MAPPTRSFRVRAGRRGNLAVRRAFQAMISITTFGKRNENGGHQWRPPQFDFRLGSPDGENPTWQSRLAYSFPSTYSALETSNAPGSSTSISLTVPLSTIIA